ncbi:putative surface layer protein [Oscillibacter valericigenes Sjm18-20]|nr:putative surface layer protein [Oscillibacter valericigenes Sjm18-20]
MNKTFLHRGLPLLLAALLAVSLVLPAAAADAPLTGIDVTLSRSSPIALISGSPTTVSASAAPIPADATLPDDLKYQWTPTDSNIVTLTPVSDGNNDTVSMAAGVPGKTKITITVTSESTPGITGTTDCTVVSPGIQLNKTSLTIDKRESSQLTAITSVPDNSVTSLSWSSSNEAVATVTGNANSVTITGVSAGSAYITATLKIDGYSNFTAECAVTVNEVLADTIKGSASCDDPLSFSSIAGDISTQCSRVLNTSLSYVTSLSVPTSAGTLYYGYLSEGEPGAGVGVNENYYYYDSNGNRLLTDVTFVPKSDFSGTASIGYIAYNSSGESFQGTIEVSVSATTGITYSTVGRNRVDFNESDFSNVCQSRTGHELQYVSFSLPSSSKGTLFYKYTGSDLDNTVTSGTAYYRSKIPLLSDVTFVAADGYSGTVTISYTGRDTSGNSFSGSVSIVVSSSAGGKGNINYSTTKNREVEFETDDFDDLCEDVLDVHLRYVRFTLPSSSIGTLYYNYRSSSSTGSKVSASTSYYRSSSPYLDSVSFVPASGWTGTADIAFTGYGTNSQRFTGTVTIEVSSSSSSGRLTYSTKKNTAVRFDVDDFNDYCDDETGERLSYVRFTLPSSSYGTLRYNYYSSSSTGSTVSSSTSYYRSSSPYLDNVYFVPASSWTGTVDITFTGYSTNGQRFTGTVRVTVKDSGSGDIAYSTQQDTPVNFSVDDFDNLSEDETDRHLNYVRFTLPSSSYGTLRYNYSSSSSTGSAVSSSTSYYRSSSPYLSNITFVPASGYTGTVNISFSGYDTSGERFTGTVSVTVKASSSPGVIYYTVAAGKAVTFDLSAFQNACSARGAGTFTSASFSLPSSSTGQLRYQYVSASEPGTAVVAGVSYSASTTPLLSGISFVPAAGYTGTATLSYTGRDSGSATYSGTVVITVTSSTKSNSFNDMGNYSWASSAVEYLYANGVVYGTGNGGFSPGVSITRGSFMLMLNRAFKFTASGGAGFSDVPEGSVYADAIKIAQALGIAQGSGSNFYPTRPLSRQQAAVFLARAMRADGWTLTSGIRSELSGFSDSTAVSGYAVDDLAAMVRMGIFQGGSNGKLSPQSPLTRAQMAVILCRAITL